MPNDCRGYRAGCPVTFVTGRPSASLSFGVRHDVTELLLIGRQKFAVGSNTDARIATQRCLTDSQRI